MHPLQALKGAKKSSPTPGLFDPAVASASASLLAAEPHRPYTVGFQSNTTNASDAPLAVEEKHPHQPEPQIWQPPKPVPIETTRRSNRTALARKVEDIASQAPSVAPTRASSPVPQNESVVGGVGGGNKKSLASSIFWPTVKGPDSPQLVQRRDAVEVDYFNLKPTPSRPAVAAAADKTVDEESEGTPTPTKTRRVVPVPAPIPVETSRRSNKRVIPSGLADMPPTPPPSEPSPGLFAMPKPFETTRRSNRVGRPLVPQPAEEAPRSNLSRRIDNNPEPHLDLSGLPQPITTSRWSNRIKPGARHLRRNSTVQAPATPSLYYFVPPEGEAQKTKKADNGAWARPEDHVEHFAGGESRPQTPSGSNSREGSFIGGGSSPKSKLNPAISGQPVPKGAAVPIPIIAKDNRRDSDDTASTELAHLRAKARGETIRPKKIDIPPTNLIASDSYPICASPTRDATLPDPRRIPSEDQAPIRGLPGSHLLAAVATPPIPLTPGGKPAMTKEQARANLLRLLSPAAGTPAGLPTPPNSKTPSRQYVLGRLGLPPHLANVGSPLVTPSPGITVASLPPRPVNTKPSPLVPTKPEEVSDEFVQQVWRYLGMGAESVARRYDVEIADKLGWRIEDVREDRMKGLREYVKGWVSENGDVDGGERGGKGMW